MVKTLSTMRIEGNFLNLIRSLCKKSTANIIFNDERPIAFPVRSRTRQGGTLSPLFLHIVLEVLAMIIIQVTRIKGSRLEVKK